MATKLTIVSSEPVQQEAPLSILKSEPVAAPAEDPNDYSLWHSAANAFGIPTSGAELHSTIDSLNPLKSGAGALPGVSPIVNYIQQLREQEGRTKQEVVDSIKNVKAGQPVLQNIGKGLAGMEQGAIGAVPMVGPIINRGSEQMLKKNYSGATGTFGALLLQALLSKGGGKAPEPVPEAAYLNKLPAPVGTEPITLTAGERAGPGAVNAIEPIAAKTSLVAGKVAKFLADRQAVLKQSLDNYRRLITQGAPAPAPSDLAAGVQNEGAAALHRSQVVRDALNEQRASSLTGQPSISPAEAGGQVADAVNKINDSALTKEGGAIGAVRQAADAQGIKVPYQDSAALAKSEFERNAAAEAAGKGLYPADIKNVLQKMSGQGIKDSVAEGIAGKGTTYDTLPVQLKVVADKMIAATPNEHPFGAAADARSAINQAVRRMDRAGELDAQSKAALQKLSESLTSDMTRALPPELAAPWEAARSAYSAQKASVRGNQFLSSLTREVGNPKGESVLSTLFQKGNESDAAALMSHLKNDPKTTAVLQRQAMDFIHDAPDARTALKNLEQRPGFETILGDKYQAFLRSLQNQAALEFSPAEANYRKFLKGVTNMQEPEKIAQTALKSPAYAGRIQKLLEGRPEMGKQFGQQLFQQVLDNSTKNGAFGTKGAYFDPVKFAEQFKRSDATLSTFIDPEVMTNLRDFSNSVEKLTFSHKVPLGKQGTLIANFKVFKTLNTAVNTLVAGLGYFFGHPWTGAAYGAAMEMVPRAFIQAALSPTGSRFLAGETRMMLLARQGTAAGILGAQATNPRGENGQPQQAAAPQPTIPAPTQ